MNYHTISYRIASFDYVTYGFSTSHTKYVVAAVICCRLSVRFYMGFWLSETIRNYPKLQGVVFS
jgi:hypothetical protein